ncbi:MAG: helix-turn-helix transcriptional regulator [Rivularia sp. (in: Bacteria)]|nr:helix-turn-helix transcriptional regulator [Rivularia sp. MS3]
MCQTAKLTNTVYEFDGFSFYSSLEKSTHWCEHSHEEIQITLPQTNALAWMKLQSSDGKKYVRQIKPGQVFLVTSNQDHALEWQQPAELTLFYLTPSFLASAIGDSIEEHHLEIDNNFLLMNDTLIKEVGVIFRYLCNFGVAKERLYFESLANLLAIHLLKNYFNYDLKISNHCDKLSQPKLNLVFEYIENNLDSKISLTDLATTAGIGKFYFSRLFKSSTNVSPYRYVLQQRIKRAKSLLTRTDMPICNIALECGFSNQSHMAKYFRMMVGTSPKKFRNNSDLI